MYYAKFCFGRRDRFESCHTILTVLPKAVIIKLKFLKEMHTVTKISEDSETVFYIYFLICNKTKNKQLPISKLLALYLSFYLLTPTIDKEPQVIAHRLFRYLKAKKYTKKRLEKPIALN